MNLMQSFYWFFKFCFCSNYVVFTLLLLKRKAFEYIINFDRSKGHKPSLNLTRSYCKMTKAKKYLKCSNITDLHPFEHELNYLSQEKVIYPFGELMDLKRTSDNRRVLSRGRATSFLSAKCLIARLLSSD